MIGQTKMQVFQSHYLENNVKNIQKKTIFEMMSLHCAPNILYWTQAELYCQIIWVNFTNMVAIFFSPSGCPHLAHHSPSPVRISPLLPDPPPLLMWGNLLLMAPFLFFIILLLVSPVNFMVSGVKTSN